MNIQDDLERTQSRVLIVDDEDSIRDSLEIILREAGYEVVTSPDAQTAVSMIEQLQFDVAVVDRILPGSLDGIQIIEQIKKHNPLCETVLMSGYPSFESAAKLMEHEPFAYLTKPIFQDEICRVVDEAARKCRLRRENERTESILQGVFNASLNPIIVYDHGFRIRFVNPAFTCLLGYAREQVLGSSMLFVPENESEILLNDFRALLDGREIHERGQLMIRSDGAQLQTARIISLCRDPHTDCAHILVIIRDLTEEKKMQAQVMQAEKLAMLGELSAKLAHEINNPLQIISGQTELMLRKELDDDIAEQLVLIEHAARKIERLTGSLMFVARPKPLRLSCFAPEKPLDKAAEFLLAMGQTKYLTIVRDYSCVGGLIEGDENQLEQVCMNLILNAAHAVAEAPEKSITLRTRADFGSGLVHISVADTGCGIEAHIRDRIFEPFFTTKPAGSGNGLGLSVVKQIVARNAGSVSVVSEPGAGSTFTVTFPLKIAPGSHRDMHVPGPAVHDEAVIQEKSA